MQIKLKIKLRTRQALKHG